MARVCSTVTRGVGPLVPPSNARTPPDCGCGTESVFTAATHPPTSPVAVTDALHRATGGPRSAPCAVGRSTETESAQPSSSQLACVNAISASGKRLRTSDSTLGTASHTGPEGSTRDPAATASAASNSARGTAFNLSTC
ncbi:MAG: hypothetical protein U0326_03345 [Polyangiales bacterium]